MILTGFWNGTKATFTSKVHFQRAEYFVVVRSQFQLETGRRHRPAFIFHFIVLLISEN